MSDECNDPNPDHCGICFELYERGSSIAPNNRCASRSCRHAMCYECAIQHVVAFDRTTCPFCRAPGAYGVASFNNSSSGLLLHATHPTDYSAIERKVELLCNAMVSAMQLSGTQTIHEESIVTTSTQRSSVSFSWRTFTLHTSVVSHDENAVVATAAVIDSAVATEPSS